MSRVIYLDERKQIVVGDGDTHLMEVGATVGPAGLWSGSEATITSADNADLVPVRDASDSNNPKFITRANFLSGVGGTPTVREVDGTPSISASTAIEFPNGSLSEPSSGVARFLGLPGAIVRRNSTQSIPNVTFEPITFDNPAVSDLGGFWNNSNPTRLTVPTGLGGVYLITAVGSFAVNGSGVRQLNIRINGSTYYQMLSIAPTILDVYRGTSSIELVLAAGDYIELTPYQTSGGSLDFGDSPETRARLSMHWIRGA